MNQAERDFLYLARDVLPWLKYLEKRRTREKINHKSIPKNDKEKRELEKFF